MPRLSRTLACTRFLTKAGDWKKCLGPSRKSPASSKSIKCLVLPSLRCQFLRIWYWNSLLPLLPNLNPIPSLEVSLFLFLSQMQSRRVGMHKGANSGGVLYGVHPLKYIKPLMAGYPMGPSSRKCLLRSIGNICPEKGDTLHIARMLIVAYVVIPGIMDITGVSFTCIRHLGNLLYKVRLCTSTIAQSASGNPRRTLPKDP